MKEINCDICVIGGGPAGYVAAIRASQLGRKVVLFEKSELGGTCLNRGCIPTKALLRTAEAMALVKKLGELGIEPLQELPKLKSEAMEQRGQNIVASLRSGLEMLMKKNGVEVVKAEAQVKAPGLVTAETGDGGLAVRSGALILATGSHAVRPPVPGAGLEGVITSDGALASPDVPGSIVIIGSGAVGMEFAAFYRALGAEVTVAEMLPRALPGADAELSNALGRAMKKNGVKFRLGAKVTEFRPAQGGIETVFEQNGKTQSIISDKVLLAAGRRPCEPPEELVKLGLGTERGAVKTDGHMRASLPGVYACGDAVGGALLAHLAFAEGRIAAENACGLDTAIDRAAVPACVYTSPEAAWVGLGEEAARESGRAVRTGRFDMRANGRSLCLGERDGFAKVVTDEKTGAILGGCILGESASEMLTALTLAVRFGLTASDLADTIFPHPTVSEALGEACADAAGRAIHK